MLASTATRRVGNGIRSEEVGPRVSPVPEEKTFASSSSGASSGTGASETPDAELRGRVYREGRFRRDERPATSASCTTVLIGGKIWEGRKSALVTVVDDHYVQPTVSVAHHYLRALKPSSSAWAIDTAPLSWSPYRTSGCGHYQRLNTQRAVFPLGRIRLHSGHY